MLIGTIQNAERLELTVVGGSIPEVREQLEEQRPEGFELLSAPVSMSKTDAQITAHATYERRDQVREVTGDSFEEVKSLVPEGWRLLFVRTP